MGIEGMRLVEDEHLPSRIISSPLVVELVGLPDRAGIEHVGAGKCVLFRQFMVDFDREVILRGDLLTRKGKNPRIPCSQRRAVWQRVKSVHKAENIRINRDLPGGEVADPRRSRRSEEHTSELQSLTNLVCRLLLEKKKIDA